MVEKTFACLNCASTLCDDVYRDCVDYYLGKPSRVSYVRCRRCGLVQQSPVCEDVLESYDGYPIHAQKSALYDAFRRVIMSPAYFDASALPEGAVILDYGCGDGWYLRSLEGRGLVRVGFEPNAEHAARLSERLGIDVFCDVDALLEAVGGTVDAVTMHFVVEHLTDLHETFAAVDALLKANGTLYFSVPNLGSWESRVFKRKWHSLDPPRHISFPDREVAENLVAEHGMHLTASRPVPFANGVAGSLPVLLAGRFSYPLFLLSLPLGILMSRLAPSGAMGFSAEKMLPQAAGV